MQKYLIPWDGYIFNRDRTRIIAFVKHLFFHSSVPFCIFRYIPWASQTSARQKQLIGALPGYCVIRRREMLLLLGFAPENRPVFCGRCFVWVEVNKFDPFYPLSPARYDLCFCAPPLFNPRLPRPWLLPIFSTFLCSRCRV